MSNWKVNIWPGSKKGAAPFTPHQFETRQETINRNNVPGIFITPEAYADMLTIANLSGFDEIGWLGSVLTITDYRFLIDGIFLFQQEVHGATTEITEEGLADLFTDLIIENEELAQRLMFWGHVHPSSSTSPSGQDDDQMKHFSHNPWFIRGIFGRSGRAEFTFYDYQRGIIWQDVPWQISRPLNKELTAKWQAEIDAKVTQKAEINAKVTQEIVSMARNYGGYYSQLGYSIGELEEANSLLDSVGVRIAPRSLKWQKKEVIKGSRRDSQNNGKLLPITNQASAILPLCGQEPTGDECFFCSVKDSCHYFEDLVIERSLDDKNRSSIVYQEMD